MDGVYEQDGGADAAEEAQGAQGGLTVHLLPEAPLSESLVSPRPLHLSGRRERPARGQEESSYWAVKNPRCCLLFPGGLTLL